MFPNGASISAEALPNTAGSLGIYFKDKDRGTVYVLTAAHHFAQHDPMFEEDILPEVANKLIPVGSTIL